MRYKKRRGSDDSFVDDDDDYEKIARKRKIVKYGKTIGRASITDHIKKLVDDDGEDDNDNDNEDKPAEEKSLGMISKLFIERKEMFICFVLIFINSITITK